LERERPDSRLVDPRTAGSGDVVEGSTSNVIVISDVFELIDPKPSIWFSSSFDLLARRVYKKNI